MTNSTITSRRVGYSIVMTASLLVAALGLGGCQTDAGTDSLIGAGLGAGIGAIIGHNVHGQTGNGAAIGAGVGALTGYILGNETDKHRMMGACNANYDY